MQVGAFHAPLRREDTNVKTAKQRVMNKRHVKYTYMQRLIICVKEYRIKISIKTLKDRLEIKSSQFVSYNDKQILFVCHVLPVFSQAKGFPWTNASAFDPQTG